MNSQQVGEIAEAAFKSHFGDVKLFRANVRRGFDYDPDDPMVDVTIIYDGKTAYFGGRMPWREVRREARRGPAASHVPGRRWGWCCCSPARWSRPRRIPFRVRRT